MTSAGSLLPPTWEAPPDDLSLAYQAVHIWAVPLEQSALVGTQLSRWLSPDEQARAGRFHFLVDRNRYIIAHGALRDVLGHYVQHAPADVLLRSSPEGKPTLVPEKQGAHLHFNLSHSHTLALIAVGRERRVGIDVERLRVDLNADEIAARFFSPRETATLRALPHQLQLQAFFACWTQKEAYLKARGAGLLTPLSLIEVVGASGRQSAALVRDAADPQAVSHWSLRALDVGASYVASIAVEGRDWHLCQWMWRPERATPRAG